MASNDSGVDTSNDSNDSSLIVPLAIELPNAFPNGRLALDGFALPLAWSAHRDDNDNASRSMNPHALPSGSHSHSLKMVCKGRSRASFRSDLWVVRNERRLLVAVNTCSIEHLTRFLQAGTDPNCVDEHKRSALHLAACRGYPDVVTQLLKFGANPNILDSLGNTPLHLAVISATSINFNLVVRIMLAAGASVHIVNINGKNPLELAESRLRLLRLRYQNPNPDMSRLLEDMCRLTILIFRHFVKQKKDIDDLAALEGKMQNLNTNDVVTEAADTLLASVERLSITK